MLHHLVQNSFEDDSSINKFAKTHSILNQKLYLFFTFEDLDYIFTKSIESFPNIKILSAILKPEEIHDEKVLQYLNSHKTLEVVKTYSIYTGKLDFVAFKISLNNTQQMAQRYLTPYLIFKLETIECLMSKRIARIKGSFSSIVDIEANEINNFKEICKNEDLTWEAVTIMPIIHSNENIVGDEEEKI